MWELLGEAATVTSKEAGKARVDEGVKEAADVKRVAGSVASIGDWPSLPT